MTTGRITFAGNPWPLGHAVTGLQMTLRGGDADSVRLHLHVESAPFDANGPGRPSTGGVAGAWDDPATWVAHQPAVISSLEWGNAGIPVHVDNTMSFDEIDLTGTYTADDDRSVDLSATMEDRAFGANVLGTAAVGGHEITLTRTGPNLFDLQWRGRLARTWQGETDLDHEFTVDAHEVRLS